MGEGVSGSGGGALQAAQLAAGGEAGLRAFTGLKEVTLQKLGHEWKKMLGTEETDLYELGQSLDF